MSRLSRRLEFLESRIGDTGESVSPYRSSRESTAAATHVAGANGDAGSATESQVYIQEPRPTEKDSGGNLGGCSPQFLHTRSNSNTPGWYSMVNEARNTTIDRLYDQGLLAAEDQPPNVDNAIASLNGALAALGNLKIDADDQRALDPSVVLTREEQKQCIEGRPTKNMICICSNMTDSYARCV